MSELMRIINREGIWGQIAIPSEQREFVWGARNIVELLDSICKNFFLGTIVYKINNGETLIYDGQQRIKTLQMVFGKDSFKLPGDKNLKNKECRVYVDINLFYCLIKAEEKLNEIGNNENINNIIDELKKILEKIDDTIRLEQNMTKEEVIKRIKEKFPKFKNYRANKWGTYPFEVIPKDIVNSDSFIPNDLKNKKEFEKFIKDYRTGWSNFMSNRWVSLYALINQNQFNEEERDKIKTVRKFITKQLKKKVILSYCINQNINIDKDKLAYLFLVLNRAGKPVSDAEQYFAMLKSKWPDASKAIGRIENLYSVLNDFDKLSILVNIAHNMEFDNGQLKFQDRGKYLNLELRNFNEESVQKLEALYNNLEPINNSIQEVIEKLREKFYYGIHCINKRLLTLVIVLYYKERNAQNNWNDDTWKNIAKNIFIINESGVLGESRGKSFLGRLFANAWGGSLEVNDEKQIKINEKFKERINSGDGFKGNHLLWLSIFQKVSPNETEFEIDHILPKNWVKNLRANNENLKNAVNNNLGNLWIIDAGTNSRWLDNFSPRDKFNRITGGNNYISIIKGGIIEGNYLDNLCLNDYIGIVNQIQHGEGGREAWRQILRNQRYSEQIAKAIKNRGKEIIKKVKGSLGIE